MRHSLESLAYPTSGVCVGLDPDLTKLPLQYGALEPRERVVEFSKRIIGLTSEDACAYKVQRAFFDDVGIDALREIVQAVRKNAPNTPVILDAKIGDIDNTMRRYLETIFDRLDFDGVTVNPYMGDDVFCETQTYPERGFVTLVRTSNPSAKAVQEVEVSTANGKQLLWSHILDLAMDKWNNSGNIIPVLSGSVDLRDVRLRVPDQTSILYAGVGAQGGTLDPAKYLFNKFRGGVFVNSSRGIIYPYTPEDADWQSKVTTAMQHLVSQMTDLRGTEL